MSQQTADEVPDALERALPLVARFATTRDCFLGLTCVSRALRASAPAYIEHLHFPAGADDDTIIRVLNNSPQVRDVELLGGVGALCVERVARLELKKLVVVLSDAVTRLPDSLFDNNKLLTSLKVGSRSLRELPESTGRLSSLVTLDLSNCVNLASLPESTGLLRSLTTLNLSGCWSLEARPELIGQLSSLVTLVPKLDLKCITDWMDGLRSGWASLEDSDPPEVGLGANLKAPSLDVKESLKEGLDLIALVFALAIGWSFIFLGVCIYCAALKAAALAKAP